MKFTHADLISLEFCMSKMITTFDKELKAKTETAEDKVQQAVLRAVLPGMRVLQSKLKEAISEIKTEEKTNG